MGWSFNRNVLDKEVAPETLSEVRVDTEVSELLVTELPKLDADNTLLPLIRYV